jgi:hypothetical protein
LLKNSEKSYGVSSEDTVRKINALNEIKKIRGDNSKNSENEDESSESEEGDSSEDGDNDSIVFSSESIRFSINAQKE